MRYAWYLLRDSKGAATVAAVFGDDIDQVAGLPTTLAPVQSAEAARVSDALERFQAALREGPRTALAAARDAVAAGVDRNIIARALVPQLDEVVKLAQTYRILLTWQHAYEYALSVDSVAPSPNSRYVIGAAAFEVGLEVLRGIDQSRSCANVSYVESMWATAARTIPGTLQVHAETARAILDALQRYASTVQRAKKRYC